MQHVEVEVAHSVEILIAWSDTSSQACEPLRKGASASVDVCSCPGVMVRRPR